MLISTARANKKCLGQNKCLQVVLRHLSAWPSAFAMHSVISYAINFLCKDRKKCLESLGGWSELLMLLLGTKQFLCSCNGLISSCCKTKHVFCMLHILFGEHCYMIKWGHWQKKQQQTHWCTNLMTDQPKHSRQKVLSVRRKLGAWSLSG